MTTPSAPLPGWYPDPAGVPGLRYWDGREWTAVAPAGSPPPPPFQATGQPTGSPAPSSSKTDIPRGLKIALGIGAGLIALVAVNSIGDSDKKPAASPTNRASASSNVDLGASSATKTAVIAPVGTAVRDGKFEFQVLGVERGSKTKEDVFNTERAKGEFFTVRLRVTNVGDDARSFSASSQHLIVNGNKYDATSFLGDNSWMEDINPGLSIDSQAVFDIPPGAAPEAIECHDSMFSGGALLGLPAS